MKKQLERKIERVNGKIEKVKRDQDNESDSLPNYHGGWNLGYWEGKLAAYENMLDKVEGGDWRNE